MITSPLVLTRWNLIKYGDKYVRDNSIKLCFRANHKLRAHMPKTSIHHDFDWYIHPQNPYILKIKYDVNSYLDVNYTFS